MRKLFSKIPHAHVLKITTFFLIILLYGQSLYAAEEILSYSVNIKVEQDSSLIVRERIRVKSERINIRRGIYRDFPTDYRTESGRRVRVGFQVLSVQRDGRPEKYHLKRQSNGTRVYMGKKDVILPPGEYVYDLTFRTTRQLGFFDTFDELYFNAIGHGWIFPILEASIIVQLPEAVSSNEVTLRGYTGRMKSTEQAIRHQAISSREFQFVVTRPLAPSEGVTIVVSWPKGIVQAPTLLERLMDYVPLVFGGLMFFCAFLLQYLLWKFFGVDPKPGSVYPRFKAPPEMEAYDIPYFQNMGYHPKCLSAALVICGIKRHLEILEEPGFFGFGSKVTLKRVYSEREPLTVVEESIINTLFAEGDLIECDQKNYQNFSACKSILKNGSQGKFTKHFKLNSWYAALIIIPSIFLYFFGGFLFANSGMSWLNFILVPIGTLSAVIFASIVKKYTKLGRAVLDEVEGYRLYLEKAEKGHYDKVEFPDISEETFEYHFPFAVALGVEAEWMKALRNSLERAGKPMNSYQPYFYRGNNSFDSSNIFTSAGGFASTISSASTAPGSSSGSSGGSSGGGGGGGGGGGW